MFSLEKGTPIALIKGGKYNGQILRITDEEPEEGSEEFNLNDPFEVLIHRGFFANSKKIPKKNWEGLREFLVETDGYVDESIKDLLAQAEETLKECSGKEFIISDGKLELIPSLEGREEVYIAAASGAGKTYFAMQYMAKYQELFPENKIIIFTSKTEMDEKTGQRKLKDSTINKFIEEFNLKVSIFDLYGKTDPNQKEPDFIKETIDINLLANKLVFFDDVVYLKDTKMQTAVQALLKNCMGVGREFNITVVSTSHLVTDYSRTRFILSDSKYIVMFPHYSLGRGIEYFLKEYGLINNYKIRDRIINPKGSRWVVFHTKKPRFILTETNAFFV